MQLVMMRSLSVARSPLGVCVRLRHTVSGSMWRHVRTCKLCVQGGATSDAVSDGGHGSVTLVHLTLAHRLSIPRESLLYSEAGWRARVVLSWLRLVRAGKVRAARRVKSDVGGGGAR